MTDPGAGDQAAADQRARVEALRQRRAPRAGASVPPAEATGPTSRRTQRRHVAGRSRVGVATFSVAIMLGLVGVMGLTRPADSAAPTAPVGTTVVPVRVLSAVPTAAPAPAPGAAIAAPPVALTARPSVQVTTPTTAAPAARTNGSR